MLKNIYIKLTKVGPTAGPFNIYDQWNTLIASNVSREDLINGVGYFLDIGVTLIKVVSVGSCVYEKTVAISSMTSYNFFTTETEIVSTGCTWTHLKSPGIFNQYYGSIEPYIIEHVFSYSPQDNVLQSFKSYDKVYQYIAGYDASFSTATFVELDDVFFNKLVVYNNQQSSGILELVPKPMHNLSEYMRYPIYNSESRSILYTKSDNFYQINDIYDVVEDKSVQLFLPSCESLSLDKEVNQGNMVYTQRSFNKSQLRAKDSKIRFYLTDRSDVHVVSQFIISSTMISYK